MKNKSNVFREDSNIAFKILGRTPLTVSVRLDEDGVASTRSANDLVGQGTVNLAKDGSWSKFDIELVGRGVVGKFLTDNKAK